MEPLVSVVLPLRAAAATLDECLESLAAQTLQNFEIVAVDHGSKDETAAILERWEAREPRLKRLVFEGESLPGALNEGLKACRGRYIARMDGDDLALPRRLEAQAAYLQENPGCALLSSQIELFSDLGLSEGYQAYAAWVNALCKPEEILRELFVECPLPHPTWMAPRETFERLKGYQDDNLPEDYSFVLRAAEAGLKLAKLPEVLLRWREHPGRHSRSHPRYGRQAFFKLKARHIKSMLLKREPCVLWGAGDRGRLLARCLLEEGAGIEFVVGISQAENPPSSVHGIPVFNPSQVPELLPGPMICCVGAPGAREEIRAWASGRGLSEARDYWFAS